MLDNIGAHNDGLLDFFGIQKLSLVILKIGGDPCSETQMLLAPMNVDRRIDSYNPK
jgi:hypothetical protein